MTQGGLYCCFLCVGDTRESLGDTATLSVGLFVGLIIAVIIVIIIVDVIVVVLVLRRLRSRPYRFHRGDIFTDFFSNIMKFSDNFYHNAYYVYMYDTVSIRCDKGNVLKTLGKHKPKIKLTKKN